MCMVLDIGYWYWLFDIIYIYMIFMVRLGFGLIFFYLLLIMDWNWIGNCGMLSYICSVFFACFLVLLGYLCEVFACLLVCRATDKKSGLKKFFFIFVCNWFANGMILIEICYVI